MRRSGFLLGEMETDMIGAWHGKTLPGEELE